MRLYAGDINSNRKDEKKVCRNTNIDLLKPNRVIAPDETVPFRKQNGENFFPVLMFYSPI